MSQNDPYADQMGQPTYGQNYGEPDWTEPRRTSVASVLSLISALIFCIPVVTQLLGLLFGIAGIISVSMSNGRRKGTGLALAGIITSTLVLAGWVLFSVFLFNGMDKITIIPRNFVTNLQSGNIDQARDQLTQQLSDATSDDALLALKSELESRYGSFVSAETDWQLWRVIVAEAEQTGQPKQYQNVVPWGVTLTFSNETVHALFVMSQVQNPQNPQSPADLFRIKSMTVLEPDGTLWYFPESEAPQLPDEVPDSQEPAEEPAPEGEPGGEGG